jgi:environmental stress-induced protein Ves
MSWALILLNEVASVPWRNGCGITRELLAWPSPGDWALRISVAEVERDGPFSQYPGVQRWFAVLSGGGVRLTVAGQVRELRAGGEPFQFDGDADTHCQLLAGPTQDFNLMLRGGAVKGTASVQRLRGSHAASCKAGTFVAAYSHQGNTAVRHGVELLEIPPNALAWRILDSDGQLELLGEDALWMEITP